MIEIFFRSLKDGEFKKIESAKKGSWILVSDPVENEVEFLVEKFNLDKGHILDALDAYEAPRLEIEGDDIYIFTRSAFDAKDPLHGISTTPVLFVLTPDFLITIVKEKIELFNNFLVSGNRDIFTTQKTKILLTILLKMNMSYRHQINAINKNIRSKQEGLEKISDKDIKEFVRWEGVLNDFITSLVPISNTYKTLLSKNYLKLFKDDQELVEDLSLANDETIDICKTNIKTIVNLREAYSTIVTNDLNKTIKFLTAITIILTLPTMVASVFGMNVELPLQNNPLGFVFILGGVFILSLLAFWFFYKKNWL